MRLIILISLLLLLPAWHAQAEPLIVFPTGADEITIPIARGDMLIFVRPTINDQDAGWFILDTGAGNNIIDTGVAEKIGLTAVGKSVVGGAGGKQAQATIFRPRSFRMDQVEVRPHELVGIDLTHLTTGRGVKTCGLIGHDIFGAGPFTIDYQKQTLTLHDPRTFKPPQDARELPLIIERPRLNANVKVDGRFEGKVMLDTGYEGGILLNGGYLCKFFDLYQGRRFRESAALGISGQPVGSRSDMLKSVELFGHTVDHVAADFPIEPLSSDPTSTYSRMGILGGLLLRHFRLTYDYDSARVWVKWQGDDTIPDPRPAGFDINARDLMGMTALCRAARWGNTEVALKWLAAGADPKLADATSRAAIHFAAERGDLRLAKALRKAGVSMETATDDGVTPLMLAAQEGHVDFARALIAGGARPDARAKNGATTVRTCWTVETRS